MNWDLSPRIRIAARLILSGEVVAYPTEAVWGLGCDPMNAEAVEHLLWLKKRPIEKGLIVIAANADQLRPYLGAISADELRRLSEATPTPTTWVVPTSPLVPKWVTGGRKTLAVRVTRHRLAAALCRQVGGPIISTSANPQGRPPAKSAMKVHGYFRNEQVYVVPGPLGKAGKPSEIRDLRSGEVLRSGS